MGTAPKTPKTPPEGVKVGIGDVVLDRYRVVEQIASGGHSVVFRGTDERLSRPVCIKVFSGLGGKSGVGRTSYEHFVQEAFALSRLTHPNTLRIYDFGHLGIKGDEGMPLQVCEFMNGGTLSQIVREKGCQSLAETARIIGAMCAALSEAHALGIVHRDIKPQNILFGSVGSSKLPKLADFGIAKWSGDDENEQRAEDTAIVAGQKLAMYSPSWAAPEQLAGQPVSAATDIYSLAVVAIYMLSGKAIFADEDVYAGYKKRRAADDLVREALTPFQISQTAIKLLSKALTFDPKQRLTSVDEFQRELSASADESAATAKASVNDLQLTPTTPVAAITPPTGTPTAKDEPPPPRYPTYPTPPPSNPTPPHMAAQQGRWSPPVPATEPWMNTAESPTGQSHRIGLSDQPQQVADRRVHFIQTASTADLAGGQSRVRITYLSSPTHSRLIHVKGLSCFVAPVGGRPSPAVTLEQPSDIALVTPRAQEIGHIRVATGANDNNGHLVFPIGSDRVAVALEDCSDPILFDFGPGSDAYFVYTQGRSIPKTVQRRR